MKLSRRAMLRGAGTALALPLLEVMMPKRVSAQTAQPTRFFSMYFPIGIYGQDYNGRRMATWRPDSAGALSSLTLAPVMTPLQSYISDFSIVSGLNISGIQMSCGEHAAAAAGFLTCAEPPDWQNTVDNSDSVNQIIGHQYQTQYGHRYPGLVTSPNSKSGQDSFSPAIWIPGYSGHISYWNHNHVDKWTDPLQLFDTMFGTPDPNLQAAADTLRRKKSVLDSVLASANRLSAKLGAADRARLGHYLDSVRDVETQLQATAPPVTVTATRPPASVSQPGDDRAFDNANYVQRVNTFIDLILLAFQAGLTGVGNLMLDAEFSTGGNGDGDTRVYTSVPDFTPFNGADASDQHHSISHTDDFNAMISINRNQVLRFATLIDKMKAINEPTGTMFDTSVLLYGSGLCDSNEHKHLDLPILVGGKGAGLSPGKHIWYEGDGRPLADLHLTIMQKLGVNQTSFADSTGPLTEL